MAASGATHGCIKVAAAPAPPTQPRLPASQQLRASCCIGPAAVPELAIQRVQRALSGLPGSWHAGPTRLIMQLQLILCSAARSCCMHSCPAERGAHPSRRTGVKGLVWGGVWCMVWRGDVWYVWWCGVVGAWWCMEVWGKGRERLQWANCGWGVPCVDRLPCSATTLCERGGGGSKILGDEDARSEPSLGRIRMRPFIWLVQGSFIAWSGQLMWTCEQKRKEFCCCHLSGVCGG